MSETRKFNTSKESYDIEEGAQNFLKFLASENGQFFQKVLFEAFFNRLGEDKNQKILDVACGAGWLSNKISESYPNVEGCDGSRFFLQHARKSYPKIKFTDVDLNGTLPYSDNEFDTLVMSMAAHDVEDQVKTFTELRRILKPGGKLMLTMVNPYYGYPVAVWKHTLLTRLLMRKPRFLVRPYHWFAKQKRSYTFHNTLESYFYKMSEHLNHITDSGFTFTHMEDLESKEDSPHFNFQYRMYRFPVLIYLEFKKPL